MKTSTSKQLQYSVKIIVSHK